jgi:hypothetical protein
LLIREVDAAKEVAVVSRPLGAGDAQLPAGSAELTGFAYVCVIDPTPDGPTATPMFIGRVRAVPDERWGGSILVTAAAPGVSPGSLLFQLDGRFLGLAIAQPDGSVGIVPADLLTAAVAAARARTSGGTR